MTVSVAVPPTATLSAISPVAYGARSTLTWSSTNASSCTALGPWSNSGTLSGSGLTNPLYSNTTFGFQCTSSAGIVSPIRYATVTVSAPANCPATTINNCNLPTTSSGNSAGSCSSTYIGSCSYSCNSGTWGSPISNVCVPPCTTPWGSTIASGVSVTAFQNPTVISPATCVSQTSICGVNGLFTPLLAYTNPTCTALNPTVTISAAPTRVQSGNSTKLSWSTTDITSCTVTGTNGFSHTGTSGTNVDSGAITSQTTFTLACNAGSPKSVVVNVVPSYSEF
ncbi:MAG: hypothetical protein ACYC4I_01865 [Minisyncoccota bacterium]